MNGLKLTSAIGLLLISAASYSLNPASGWYMGLVGGVTYVPNVDFRIVYPVTNNTEDSNLSYLIGGNGGAFIGYRLCHLRLELEGLVNDNRFSQIEFHRDTLTGSPNAHDLNMTGYTYFVSGLVNAIYEFYKPETGKTNFVPYLGLGVGYADVQSKLTVYRRGQLVGTSASGNGAGLAQAILGVNYFMDDFAAVGIDYRYMILSKAGAITNHLQPQTINLSFTYAFGK